jgi:hypothetical protein
VKFGGSNNTGVETEYYFLCSRLKDQSGAFRYCVIHKRGIVLPGSLLHLEFIDCISETWD